MAKIRCFLCGGRVSKGVCTECGMPQRQRAQNYYLNESSCDNQPLTHVHSESDSARRKARESGGRKVSPGKIVAVTIIVIVILVVAGNMARLVALDNSFFDNLVNKSMNEVVEEFVDMWEEEVSYPTELYGEYMVVDDSYYDYATYELEETGVFHDNALVAGNYVIGFHLPEGNYTFVAEEGQGYIGIDDWENSFYIYEDMDCYGEDGYPRIENIHLYNGATLYVDGSLELYITTDNAGVQREMMENPLTDSVLVSAEHYEAGGLMAGEDFPAGVYDFALHGGGWDCVDLYDIDEYGDEYYWQSYLIKDTSIPYEDDADYYAYVVRNVTIEEGTYVRISNEGNVLEMTPSEYVVPQEGEQYGEYY